MTITYKVLGQVLPAANTPTTLYEAPAATSAVASTLTICNQGVTTAFRVAVRPAGAALAPVHYIVYDSSVNTNDAVFLTLGVTLAATDVITVQASTANVSFSLFGQETT
jgi:hypothetical protein